MNSPAAPGSSSASAAKQPSPSTSKRKLCRRTAWRLRTGRASQAQQREAGKGKRVYCVLGRVEKPLERVGEGRRWGGRVAGCFSGCERTAAAASRGMRVAEDLVT
eukprot:scaffold3356_cov112-Isochrysis_galbana.AAC.4